MVRRRFGRSDSIGISIITEHTFLNSFSVFRSTAIAVMITGNDHIEIGKVWVSGIGFEIYIEGEDQIIFGGTEKSRLKVKTTSNRQFF